MNVERVKQIMKKQQISAYGLSHLTGLSESLLSKYFHNVLHPKIDKIQKIAEALKVDFKELI